MARHGDRRGSSDEIGQSGTELPDPKRMPSCPPHLRVRITRLRQWPSGLAEVPDPE